VRGVKTLRRKGDRTGQQNARSLNTNTDNLPLVARTHTHTLQRRRKRSEATRDEASQREEAVNDRTSLVVEPPYHTPYLNLHMDAVSCHERKGTVMKYRVESEVEVNVGE